jgi:nitroreductase
VEVPDTFLKLFYNRHCCRAFTADTVPRDLLETILAAAAQAPSSKNTQPWQVAVAMGTARDRLAAALCAAFDASEPLAPDYRYTPDPDPPGFRERARACGFALFDLKGIDPADRAARRAHGRENFTFFGAPVALVFHLPRGVECGNFLDLGMFMQNVMLALVAAGLGSCPQASVAGYPDVIRRELGLSDDRLIVAGMAVGRPDPSARVNSFVPERLPLAEFVQWRE